MTSTGTRFAVVFAAMSLLGGGGLLLNADRRDAATAPPQLPIPTAPSAPLDATLYAEAAIAARDGNLELALGNVQAVVTQTPGQGVHTPLLAGLYAYAAGDVARARRLLGAAPAADRNLEDWRLLALGEAAATAGDRSTAIAALERLLADHPGSPLRPRAAFRAASLLRAAGDHVAALELVDAARAENLSGEYAHQLEELAWQIGRETGAVELAREAARELLVDAPLSPAAAGVEAALTLEGTSWRTLLDDAALQQRATNLLAAGEPLAASEALAAVELAQRDATWRLLQAEAHARADRGDDALALLADFRPADDRERARLAWVRALAEADQAQAVRGRQNLSASGRVEMRRLANRHLAEVASLGTDPDLARQALEALYAQYSDGDDHDRAVAVLRQLRVLDPADKTGARNLWERGWQDYKRNNRTGAIGYWSTLEELYPETGDAHRGRYWKARAWEKLGQRTRALELYRELAAGADTVDFYHRQAVARLGGMVIERDGDAALVRIEPWTIDAKLARARLLTELGLDGLGLAELDLLGESAPERDRVALRGLILGRQGDRVTSVLLLREAYPALGGSYQASVPEEIRRGYYPMHFEDVLRAQARRSGVPVHVIAGIIRQESAFDPRATSRAGARGLMQLMPATGRDVARQLQVPYSLDRLYDPDFSVLLGSSYFRQVLDSFDGNLELALAGYNGGPNRIRRMWKSAGKHAEMDVFVENLGLEESKIYVKRVLVLADSYRQLYPGVS